MRRFYFLSRHAQQNIQVIENYYGLDLSNLLEIVGTPDHDCAVEVAALPWEEYHDPFSNRTFWEPATVVVAVVRPPAVVTVCLSRANQMNDNLRPQEAPAKDHWRVKEVR